MYLLLLSRGKEKLLSMGFERIRAASALRESSGSVERALDALLS